MDLPVAMHSFERATMLEPLAMMAADGAGKQNELLPAWYGDRSGAVRLVDWTVC